MTISTLQSLLSILNNSRLTALYTHSPNLKLRDASFLLLLAYLELTYATQREGLLEHAMYSIYEAEKVAQGLLPDSIEANSLIDTYKRYLVTAVDSAKEVQ